MKKTATKETARYPDPSRVILPGGEEFTLGTAVQSVIEQRKRIEELEGQHKSRDRKIQDLEQALNEAEHAFEESHNRLVDMARKSEHKQDWLGGIFAAVKHQLIANKFEAKIIIPGPIEIHLK